MLFRVCFRVIFKKQNLVDKDRKLSFNSTLPYNLTPECTGAALTRADCAGQARALHLTSSLERTTLPTEEQRHKKKYLGYLQITKLTGQ